METQNDFILGETKSGSRWLIRIIKSGLSGNHNYYSDEVLRKSAPLFERARVFVKSDHEHLKGQGKDVRNIIGQIREISFVQGMSPDEGELQGTLELISPNGEIASKIKEAWDKNMSNLFGFSIDAQGKTSTRRIGRHMARVCNEITTVASVDLIVEPGAGGQILNILESLEGQKMEHLNATEMKSIISASSLPQPAKDKLYSEFKPLQNITGTELKEAISREKEYLAKMSESGHVTGLGSNDFDRRSTVRIIEGQDEKSEKMLDAFFDPQDHSVVSIRECYLHMTGDRNFTGLKRSCDPVRLAESLNSTDFPSVLGDAISRRLIKEYQNDSIYDVWRNLVNVVPVNDFRTQERTRFGGYGNLPIVAESGSYNPLTSPTDEKATYAVAKRGGTEDLTLEMITNDDVGAVQRIPKSLVRAAKRTLSKFALDFLKDNPEIYDENTLFHASHGNLGATALGAASVAAGRLAMKSQTEKNSNEKLGITPRFLWVPDELEETAVDLFRRNTEQDRNFVQSLSLDIVPVWYWTDVNDWCLTADPMDLATVEIGFLGGKEEPDLFIQDSPTAGSMFTNDKVTYKIRHIYGGTVTDYRGAYKSVVA
ncbi:MAG: hypothetical protein CMN55_16405 [Sneathiella sp.]|jgi:hypothetical protein|uniref:phage major capsid protein n=1 Tax=Sneathiella sp. TaxID=1964365 RepID=UPI000C59839E|nr:hypothetical protein [Sneathiella sp.]MAL80660.1 hypothetical protein [Sneathiella sp.]|tara:strand:+ start:5820 stop:7613 length:1794 start_codon:yes stop_codon:yes gene_type:complete